MFSLLIENRSDSKKGEKVMNVKRIRLFDEVGPPKAKRS